MSVSCNWLETSTKISGYDMKRRSKRPPTVGEILIEEYLDPERISIADLSVATGMHRNTISKIVNDKQHLSVLSAMKLGKALKTSPEYWLNLQNAVQIWDAQDPEFQAELENIPCLRQ